MDELHEKKSCSLILAGLLLLVLTGGFYLYFSPNALKSKLLIPYTRRFSSNCYLCKLADSKGVESFRVIIEGRVVSVSEKKIVVVNEEEKFTISVLNQKKPLGQTDVLKVTTPGEEIGAIPTRLVEAEFGEISQGDQVSISCSVSPSGSLTATRIIIKS